MSFKIGDKVKLTRANNWCNGVIKQCYGNKDSRYADVYLVEFETGLKSYYNENELELVEIENVTYRHEFDYLNNVVIARFYEIRDGVETEIARNHAHILHEGILGIAQATSYALKKIYDRLNEKEF